MTTDPDLRPLSDRAEDALSRNDGRRQPPAREHRERVIPLSPAEKFRDRLEDLR